MNTNQYLNNQRLILEQTLKGMAFTMGYKKIQRMTCDMEKVFYEICYGKMDTNIVDIVFQCIDALEAYRMNIIKFQDEGTEDNEPIIAKLNTVLKEGADASVSDLKKITEEQNLLFMQRTLLVTESANSNKKKVGVQ